MTRQEEAWFLPASALTLAAGILLGRTAPALWLCIAMALCALGALLLMPRRARFAALQALVLAVGSVLGYAAYHPSLPPEGECTVSGVVAEEIRLREDGQVSTLLCGVTLNGKPLGHQAYWSFYLDENESLPEGLHPGNRITITSRVYHPAGVENPGGYNFREYLLQRGATIGLYGCDDFHSQPSLHPMGLAAFLRSTLAAQLRSVMGETAGGYAATLLLGSRHLVPAEDREAFSRLGIAHILSVSGFHVAVLAGMITRLFRRLHLSRKLRFGCTAAFMGAYVLLTGLHAPVIRAALLYLLYEFGALKHRQRSGLHLLCASWLIQLLLSPVQLTSASFHLTYGAMLGLTLVAPWLEATHYPSKRLSRPWKMLCASLGAQAGLLLPQLYWFHELPLLGIVLNLVVIIAFAWLMKLCCIVLVLLPVAPLASLAGQLTATLLDGMLIGVRFLGDVDSVSLWTCQANLLTAIAWTGLIFCSSWWWPCRRRCAALITCLVLLTVSVVPWPNHGTRYIQLSAGEADAAILQDEATTIAIDTGEDGRELAAYLHQHRLSLDALVLTHLHSDHAGGLRALLDDRIPIKTCYLPWGGASALVDEGIPGLLAELQSTGTQFIQLGRGDAISLPNGTLTALWPETGKVRPAQDGNESSLVLLAALQGSTMLLSGDLTGTYEMYTAVPTDILKVAHHGSESSTTPAFLAATAPQLLLLSCGDEDRVASVNERRGATPLLDTCTRGAIMIDFNTSGFIVQTMR